MMKRGKIWTLVAMVVSACGVASSGAEPAQDLPLLSPDCVFEVEGRVVVVGDVLIDYAGLLRILSSQGLVDEDANWIGGDAHFVQTGNILPQNDDWNRINNSKFEHEKISRLLMKLQTQARAQGGDVHSLQGILETYLQRWRTETVPIGLSKVWAGPDSQQRSEDLRARWIEDLKPKNSHFPPETQDRLRKNQINYITAYHQAGIVEMLERTGKYEAEHHRFVLDTAYAQWFRSRNVVIKINGVLYSHAGISPKLAGLDPKNPGPAMSLKEINDMLRDRNFDPTLFLPVDADLQGPIWWRSMSLMSDGELKSLTRELLPIYNAKASVVGLDADEMIVRRGGVFFINSGLGTWKTGNKLNVLVIDGDHWTIFEESRAIEEGDFGPVILEGGPVEPIIPGGGVPQVRDPGGAG